MLSSVPGSTQPSFSSYYLNNPELFVDFVVDCAEFWKDVEDTTIIGAAAPPGGGRNPITPRFMRHFNLFCIPEPNKEVLNKIFSSILNGFLRGGFVDAVQKSSDAIIDSTIEVYTQIMQAL